MSKFIKKLFGLCEHDFVFKHESWWWSETEMSYGCVMATCNICNKRKRISPKYKNQEYYEKNCKDICAKYKNIYIEKINKDLNV